ncbi:hypothetical protein GCM10007916_11840 [Psychromonas marina]|uniref:Uncharacterized protein n=1 Tax=Psychromonas marina TaxID=88364 RepID=A0ABQ6DYF7_9GAMM|nr:hypothetical protein GCM10007916_11840 [Psychromonas marina]
MIIVKTKCVKAGSEVKLKNQTIANHEQLIKMRKIRKARIEKPTADSATQINSTLVL